MEFKKFFVYPKIPERLQKLLSLSNNLWFTWNYDALSLFYKIDAETFRRFKYNAKKLLYHLPKPKFKKLAEDERFFMDLEDIWEAFYSVLKKYLGPHFIYMSPEDIGWEEILKIPDEA